MIADTRTLYPSNNGFINTSPMLLATPVAHPILIDILLSTPAPLNPGDAPFDLFIARTGDYSHQIHRPQYSGTDQMDLTLFGTGDDGSTAARHFVNTHGLPFALDIPAASGPGPISWPSERTSIDDLYPQLASFAASGGTLSTDWYDFPETQFLYAPVPEPSGLALLATGIAGIVVLSRRKA